MSQRVARRAASIVHEVGEDGDVVVFDGRGNRLLLLNDVGAAVWLLLDGRRSVGDIARVITETLPGDPAVVERDVEAFLDTLVEHAVIEMG